MNQELRTIKEQLITINHLLEIQTKLLIALCGKIVDDSKAEGTQFFDEAMDDFWDDDDIGDDEDLCHGITPADGYDDDDDDDDDYDYDYIEDEEDEEDE